MAKRITITSKVRSDVDEARVALALVLLARILHEQEQEARVDQPKPQEAA